MPADPLRDDGVPDPALAAAEDAGVAGRGGGGDVDAEFAEEGEGGFVGLGEPAVWGGGSVPWEGGVAVDVFDVVAAAAPGSLHDDLPVAAEGATGHVVGAFAVREAGLRSVGVVWG